MATVEDVNAQRVQRRRRAQEHEYILVVRRLVTGKIMLTSVPATGGYVVRYHRPKKEGQIVQGVVVARKKRVDGAQEW
jgi:hypothetical protein